MLVSHDVIKNSSQRIVDPEVLEQLKTNIETNFHFQMVFRFLIVSTLRFLLFCLTWHLHVGRERLPCWLVVVFEKYLSGTIFLVACLLFSKYTFLPIRRPY